MLKVAVTGGIGAGKSTVATALRDAGAVVVDADAIAREVVAPGEPALSRIATAFGTKVMKDDGSLDRAALAAIVFNDETKRRQLEAITHPAINAEAQRRLADASRDGIAVYDVPLLAPIYSDRFHLVITVTADPIVRLARLSARGLSRDDALRRMKAQLGDDTREAMSHLIVRNDNTPAHLMAAIERLWNFAIAPFDAALAASVPTNTTPDELADWAKQWPGDNLSAREVRRRLTRLAIPVTRYGGDDQPERLVANPAYRGDIAAHSHTLGLVSVAGDVAWLSCNPLAAVQLSLED